LVVDDQRDIRELLATVLTNHGYRVLLAADGADALAVFTAQADVIAAVITDLSMPHMEGASLADKLRRLQPDTPILFMSGSGRYESPTVGATLPAAAKAPFLLKPFRPVVLLETVHQLLRLHRTSRLRSAECA
jgi:CheY-like chemotaxis protein